MCAVIIGRNAERVIDKVVTILGISFLFRVMPHIGGQVLMREIDTTVHDTDNHRFVAGRVFFPDRENIDVTSADR